MPDPEVKPKAKAKAEKPKRMLVGCKTKLRCKGCNDEVIQYVELVSDTVDSWFCNEPTCEHSIFRRTYGKEQPDWVKDPGTPRANVKGT